MPAPNNKNTKSDGPEGEIPADASIGQINPQHRKQSMSITNAPASLNNSFV